MQPTGRGRDVRFAARCIRHCDHSRPVPQGSMAPRSPRRCRPTVSAVSRRAARGGGLRTARRAGPATAGRPSAPAACTSEVPEYSVPPYSVRPESQPGRYGLRPPRRPQPREHCGPRAGEGRGGGHRRSHSLLRYERGQGTVLPGRRHGVLPLPAAPLGAADPQVPLTARATAWRPGLTMTRPGAHG
jgi:hypothetical protein